ncbi:MAG TPA: DUF1641 domain-containing protein [Stellaceae bacterium]|nr:DUF1641 domain-containing protein [Stellaceae bacterium]
MSEARGRNQPPDELNRLAQAAREALTDTMVERLAGSAGNTLELLDRLNDEGTREALHVLLDRLGELHKTGALDTLFDTVMLLHAARNAVTDPIVDRLFAFFEQTINTVGNEAMADLADNTREALEEAAAESAQATPRGGLFAMLSLLGQPEAQRSLGFLLSFSEKFQRRMTGPGASR